MSEVDRRPEHEISGLEFSHLRGGNMSTNPAPEDYLWHHSEVGVEDGDGLVTSPYATRHAFRMARRNWLSQFPLLISKAPEKANYMIIVDNKEQIIEGPCRYWRWTDPETGRVAWWERRPWNGPAPHEAGFWPDNGGYIE